MANTARRKLLMEMIQRKLAVKKARRSKPVSDVPPLPTRKPDAPPELASVSSSFDDAFKKVIGHEGGYVNNPKDPGGETKFGIAKKYHPNVDIKNLTLEQAKAIYKKDYWDKYKLDLIQGEHAADVFDMVVNSPARAGMALQRVVGATPDGVVGPQTREKLAGFKGDLGMLAKQEYFKSLVRDKAGRSDSNYEEHVNGWANRYLETDRFGSDKDNLKGLTVKETLKQIGEE